MKKVHVKSAIPIYIAAAVWLLAGLILPKVLMNLPGLIVIAAVSVAGYFVGSKLFPGREITVEEKIETGDQALDREIAEGRARLEKLKEANAAIAHPGITKNLNRMTKAGEQIFRELGRNPRKATMVRRFMSYYLPTSEKLMDQYRLMMDAPVKGENINSAMSRIEASMDVVADAFDKCADNLFKDDEMDIDAEIKVMNTMLTGDSLIESAANSIRKVADNMKSAQGGAAQSQPEGKEREIKLTLGGH